MLARLFALLFVISPFCGFSAIDMFLKIEGIEGESTDKVHSKDIDVLAWSWGMSSTSSFLAGGGGTTGQVHLQDISITKYVDKSTPTLLLDCANGKQRGKMELFLRKPGDKPLEFLVITFENVLVTSVSTGGSGGEDRLTENVTFTFAKITVAYKAQNADGSGDKAQEFKWDQVKNEEF